MAGSGPRKNTPVHRNPDLRSRLLAMRDEDLAVRAELLGEGVLWDTYHPRMEDVHLRNARILREILDRHGWPDAHRVGADGEEAAWLILMHSISSPDLLRRGRRLVREAVEAGRVGPTRLARIEDRIRTLEGRRQLYGTVYDWDAEGLLSPYPIESPAGVDERRAAVGLPPLVDEVARRREEAARNGDRPPVDPAAKRRGYERWLRKTGWR